MRFLKPLTLCLIALQMAVFPAFAEDNADRIIFGVGKYNVRDQQGFQRDNELRVEWRMASVPVWKLHPWLGISLADESANWLGGGLETDIDLWDDWLVLTLQTGAGYFDDGEIVDDSLQFSPKSGFEFRHQIELAVRFPQGNRIGLGFSHMSNANIGGGNNAVETLTINFHVPTGVNVGR